MISRLNLFGLERKPSLYWVSVFTYSGVLRTVDTMITFEMLDQTLAVTVFIRVMKTPTWTKTKTDKRFRQIPF